MWIGTADDHGMWNRRILITIFTGDVIKIKVITMLISGFLQDNIKINSQSNNIYRYKFIYLVTSMSNK